MRRSPRRVLPLLLSLVALSTLGASGFEACAPGSEEDVADATAREVAAEPDRAEPESGASEGVLALRDLPEIRRAGEIRILAQRESNPWLPRSGSPLDAERDRVRAFARELKVEARFIPIETFGGLLPALLAGKGDLVADNMTVTDRRREQVAFSAPTVIVRDQVVTRASDATVKSPADLAGRTLHVQQSSSFWESALALTKEIPELRLEPADDSLDIDGLLDRVASGVFDLTLMDSNVMEAALQWQPELRVAFELPRDRMIAWAMRGDAKALRRAVDGFVTANAPASADAGRETRTDDLAGIRERGVLRVITRNNGTSYFISRGRLVGFEYDLARKFADDLGVRLEIIVPTSHGDMIDWLREGKGDLIAAGLTIDRDLEQDTGVAFSRDYLSLREVVVVRSAEEIPRSIDALAGRTFAVRQSSAQWRTLDGLRDQGASFAVTLAPESMETEEIIDHVAEGEYDLTLAANTELAVTRTWRDDIVGALAIGPERAQGWLVRRDNPELLAAVDAFFDREYRGVFYNVTKKKYFGNAKAMRARFAERPSQLGGLSPFDAMVRQHATSHGFDWRLVVAQMYQESRFDPKAVSFAGARGLLQVMPATARELGFQQLEDPETGIRAGLAYLRWARDRFRDMPPSEQIWFALAAYNVGFGHVRDAQRIASARDLAPDRWFDNVEQAMLLKEKPEVHRETRFGYARGREPVAYVREIRRRYQAYMHADHES